MLASAAKECLAGVGSDQCSLSGCVDLILYSLPYMQLDLLHSGLVLLCAPTEFPGSRPWPLGSQFDVEARLQLVSR